MEFSVVPAPQVWGARCHISYLKQDRQDVYSACTEVAVKCPLSYALAPAIIATTVVAAESVSNGMPMSIKRHIATQSRFGACIQRKMRRNRYGRMAIGNAGQALSSEGLLATRVIKLSCTVSYNYIRTGVSVAGEGLPVVEIEGVWDNWRRAKQIGFLTLRQ